MKKQINIFDKPSRIVATQLFFWISLGLSISVFSQLASAQDDKSTAAAKAAAKKRALLRPAQPGGASGKDSLGLTRNSVALPQSEKLLTPKVIPRNMQVVKPPRNSEFYEGNTKEVEYEKLLDKEISDLYRLSQQYRQSKNRGEIWLRLAERYKEKSKLIEFRKQAEYDRELKLFADQKTKVKPHLDLKLAHDYNLKAIELYEWFIKDFPQDQKIDQALFFLGYHNFEVGRSQVGEGYYKRLVKSYPDSEYVVESNFALGEYYFENEQWQSALENYQKVIVKRRGRLLTFAFYKAAWCFFRLNRTEAALKSLERVVKLSGGPQEAVKGTNSSGANVNKVRLAAEAVRDYVPFFAESGEFKTAAQKFYEVVQDETKAFSMVEHLAHTYSDNGNRVASNFLYKQLIQKNPNAEKAADYQFQIILSHATSDQKAFREELINWLENFGPSSQWKKENIKNQKLTTETLRLQETTLRNHVLQLHQTAQNSKSPQVQAQAAYAYVLYSKYFFDSPHALEMAFFQAELLFDMGQFDNASKLYSYVIDKSTPKTPYYEKAVINNLLALERSLPSSEEIDKKRGKSLQPIAFDPAVERFEKGALIYLRAYPKGEKVANLERRLGYFYYSYNQFDKSTPIFEKILIDRPNTENSEIAGNLILDTYKLRKDDFGLGEKAAELLTHASVANSKIGPKLREIVEASSYARADKFAESKDYTKAAKEYEKFATTAKSPELIAAAQYKAADNFEKIGDLPAAMRMHTLVVSKPNENAKIKVIQNDSRNALARLYTQTVQLEQAAKLFSSYAATNLKDPKAVNGFNNAAVLFDALNEYPAAQENYESYYKYTRNKDRNESFYLEAELLKRQNKMSLAMPLFEQYVNLGANREHIVKSAYAIATMNQKLGRIDKARIWYKKTVDIQKRFRKEGNEGVSFAAEARFKLAAEELAQLRALKFSASPKQQERVAKDILMFQNRYVKQEMGDVIRYDYGPMIVAALSSTGQMFEIIAYNFSKIPPGKDFSADDLANFKGLIGQKVSEYRKQALDAYKLSYDKSQTLEIYTEWTAMAHEALSNLDPTNYQKNSEFIMDTKQSVWSF